MDERRVVYVLRSERDPARHYVGLTTDVRSRLADHNAGGSAHTAKYRPWRLAVSIEFETQDKATTFERNPADDLLDLKLIQPSSRLAIVAVGAAVTALVLGRVNGTLPAYFMFISAGAVLPAMFLYRAIGRLINWPAFAVTTLYVIVTSLIWEVTLAIPRQWWGYEPSGMMGLTIAAWSRGDAIFPVEAAAVWLFAPFSSVLTYDFAKALMHHPRSTKTALFGSVATHARTTS